MDRLKYANNWEYDEYRAGKRDVRSLTKVKIGDTEFPVITKRETHHYTDHGHPGSATSNHFYITTVVDGIVFEKDLNTLVNKVPVFALEWD